MRRKLFSHEGFRLLLSTTFNRVPGHWSKVGSQVGETPTPQPLVQEDEWVREEL